MQVIPSDYANPISIPHQYLHRFTNLKPSTTPIKLTKTPYRALTKILQYCEHYQQKKAEKALRIQQEEAEKAKIQQ